MRTCIVQKTTVDSGATCAEPHRSLCLRSRDHRWVRTQLQMSRPPGEGGAVKGKGDAVFEACWQWHLERSPWPLALPPDLSGCWTLIQSLLFDPIKACPSLASCPSLAASWWWTVTLEVSRWRWTLLLKAMCAGSAGSHGLPTCTFSFTLSHSRRSLWVAKAVHTSDGPLEDDLLSTRRTGNSQLVGRFCPLSF